jgi:hypothetical protein
MNWKKKVGHTRTTYNFLQDHSDAKEHVVNPKKATARFTETGEVAYSHKYDHHPHLMSKSPKKRPIGVNHFA